MRIAIFGQKEHGKTTLAKMIQEWEYKIKVTGLPDFMHNVNLVSILQLSNPLKECLSLATGKDKTWLMNNKEKIPYKWKMTVREGMQKLSDCLKEIVNEDVLIERVSEVDEFIIDDGRYLFELKKLMPDTFCILLYRPDKLTNDPHSSETWLKSLYYDYDVYFNETLKDFNMVVLNNSTLENLQKKVTDEILPLYFNWEKDHENT